MIVNTLQLRNFRNYKKADISFSDGMNLITGRNGQGKTNLLEALVYLSLTRSHRINTDQELIRDHCEFADITCRMTDEEEKKLRAVIHGRGKTLSCNDHLVRKSSEFIGQLNTVLFSPDEMGIFSASPRERRRLINQEITKVSPAYLRALSLYRNLLRERNALLKNNNPDLDYLDILDHQMTEQSEMIIQSRRSFLKSINLHLSPLYKELSSEDAEALIQYRTCTQETGENLKKALEEMYRTCRERDLYAHVSTAGVHHDDIAFILNGKDAEGSASQGQKRMMLLSFRMSILKYIEETSGKRAVLLLDDVLSELDQSRQRKLLEMVQQPCQCIITCTEVPVFLKTGNIKQFEVENGNIREVQK